MAASLCKSAVLKVYHEVMDDVITGVREIFMEDGVDEQVLQELKQTWETKLMASKAVDVHTDLEKQVIMSGMKKEAAAPNGGTFSQKNQTQQHQQQQQHQHQQQQHQQQQQQQVAAAVTKHQVVAPSVLQQQQQQVVHQPPPPQQVSQIQDHPKQVPIQITLPTQPGTDMPRVLTIHVPATALQGNQLHKVLTGPVITATMGLPHAIACTLLQQHVNAAFNQQGSAGTAASALAAAAAATQAANAVAAASAAAAAAAASTGQQQQSSSVAAVVTQASGNSGSTAPPLNNIAGKTVIQGDGCYDSDSDADSDNSCSSTQTVRFNLSGNELTITVGDVLSSVLADRNSMGKSSTASGVQQLRRGGKRKLKTRKRRPRLELVPDGTSDGGVAFILRQCDGNMDTSDEEEDGTDEEEASDDDYDNKDEEDQEMEEGGPEEEPLNSEDDVTDEDPTELFDTENVVVCQYDKITRSRNKWKFHLKDGIMNLNAEDYLFQKASGDAEW